MGSQAGLYVKTLSGKINAVTANSSLVNSVAIGKEKMQVLKLEQV